MSQSGALYNQKHIHSILQTTTDGFFVVNSMARLVDVNGAYLKLTGYSQKEFLGLYISDIDADESIEDSKKRMIRIKENGSELFVARHRRKDGSLFDVEVSTTYLDFDGGHYVCFCRDTTEQNLILKALRESEERYRQLFETMSQGVVYQDAKGSIISANPAAERILGLTKEQIYGVSSMDPRWGMIQEDGTPVDGDNHPAMIALRSAQVVGPLVRGVFHPDRDAHVWLYITAIPLFREGKKEPHQVYTTFTDITAQRVAEQALHASEMNFREIFNSTNEAIFIDELSTGRMLDCNQRTVEMYGYSSKEEILKGTIGDLSTNVYPYTDEIAHDKINEAIEIGTTTFEWQGKKKGGEIFWVEVSLKATTIGGKGRVIAVVRDISDRKRAQEELNEKVKELEDFNRLMVGREVRMLDLKKEVNELCDKLNLPRRYSAPDKCE